MMRCDRRLARPPTLVGILLVIGLVATWNTSHAVSLQFAGRTWDIKQSNSPVGPGPNLFSDSPSDVWSDAEGLHLSIHKTGPDWYSTEVILDQSLGYGTYLFQTDSRQDLLNSNAVFGAFTWDPFGGSPIPGDPNREIDFEDSRFGNPSDPTNSQVTVQPFTVPGNMERLTLPDLSLDSALTRFFTWSPGKVEFTTLRGHHSPTSFSPADVIHQFTYLDNGADHRVPIPDRETFRFNLWLFNSSAPVGDEPVEVLVNDFQYFPLLPAENSVLFDFESGNQGWGSFGAITLASGELPAGGSIGQGRFHSANYSLPDGGGNFGIVDVSPAGQDLSEFVGLSVDALFKDIDGQPPFVGTKELEIIVATGSEATGDEVEYRAPVTMTDTYQTFSVPFTDFLNPDTLLAPTPTQLTDVTIKLVVRNESGVGSAELNYDQITGLMSIPEAILADFNDDGVVSLADYTVWRDSLGQTGTGLPADGNRNGLIDVGDYQLWKANFSLVAGSGSLVRSITPVPEPASACLMILGIVGALVARKKMCVPSSK